MKMQDSTDNKQELEVLDLLKKLALLQAQKTLITVGKNTIMLKDTCNDKIQEIKNYLNLEQKRYGSRQGDADKIISEYREIVQQVYETDKEERNASLERKQKYEEIEIHETVNIVCSKKDLKSAQIGSEILKEQIKEIKSSKEYIQYDEMIELAKKEIEKACKQADTQKIRAATEKLEHIQDVQKKLLSDKPKRLDSKARQIETLKMQIKLAKQNLKDSRKSIKNEVENIKHSKKQAINAISIAKNNEKKELAVIHKENVISKFVNSIKDKIGGAKKITNKVIEPLKQQITQMKNDVFPKFKSDVVTRIIEQRDQCNQFIENSKEKAKYRIGRVSDFTFEVGDRVSTGIENIKQAPRNIIESGKQKKQNFLEKVTSKLQDKIKKTKDEIYKKPLKDNAIVEQEK